LLLSSFPFKSLDLLVVIPLTMNRTPLQESNFLGIYTTFFLYLLSTTNLCPCQLFNRKTLQLQQRFLHQNHTSTLSSLQQNHIHHHVFQKRLEERLKKHKEGLEEGKQLQAKRRHNGSPKRSTGGFHPWLTPYKR